MKLLQTTVLVVAGLLAGTACQRLPPKPENVSVEPGPLPGTSARAGIDNPAEPQLDPGVQRLKEQLNLTGQQTQELDNIFKENRTEREVLTKELQNLYKKRQERINAVLTQEQLEKYEQKREAPDHPGQSE